MHQTILQNILFLSLQYFITTLLYARSKHGCANPINLERTSNKSGIQWNVRPFGIRNHHLSIFKRSERLALKPELVWYCLNFIAVKMFSKKRTHFIPLVIISRITNKYVHIKVGRIRAIPL